MGDYCLTDTIFAPATGAGAAGVAIVRVSGSLARTAAEQLAGLKNPAARYAYFRPIRDKNGELIDKGLVLYFAAPDSFTGEDVVEFQVHGGRSVIRAVLAALGDIDGCRPAERGEFSRRAVLNGKMDLTEAEGLLDLIHAETDRQRVQAAAQMSGALKTLYDAWRDLLKHHMAYLEAFIDFPEEEIPASVLNTLNADVTELARQITTHLNDQRRGQTLRDGFHMALIGPPNAGKSSLINALSQKEAAIVSETAGTTRDVVEVHLDVDGFPVILADTAGLREQADALEAEGIRRAVRQAETADLILNVSDARTYPIPNPLPNGLSGDKVMVVWNKADLAESPPPDAVSARTGAGIDALWARLCGVLHDRFCDSAGATAPVTRERYRVALGEALAALTRAGQVDEIELKAEELRLAARAIGRITGRIETDEVLDVIFRDFCIGK